MDKKTPDAKKWFGGSTKTLEPQEESPYLQAIVESSDDAIIGKTLDGTIKSWNKGAEKIYGYSSSEVIGKSISILIQKGAKDEVPQILEAIKKGRTVPPFETIRVTKSGKTIDVSMTVSPIKDTSGNIIGASTIAKDVTERKKQESPYLQAIVESSDDAIIGKTLDGTIKTWNKGAEKIYGYSEDEVIGKSISILIQKGAKDEVPEILEMIRKGSSVSTFETIRVTKDGRAIDVSITVSPIRDLSGNIIGASTIARDVSERKRQDELRSRYTRSLIEASLDPLVTISPEGKITDVNEASAKVTGVSREKLIGTDFSDYFTEPEKAREGYKQVFAKGLVSDYPLTICHKDGKLTDVLYNASVYKDDKGNVLGVFAAARDVTVQKQASKYARSLIESSLDPLVTISPEGKITDVNEASAKVTGIIREKLIGTDFSDYFTEPEKAREGYKQVFAKGLVSDYPLTIRHKDGKLTDVLYNASVYKDDKGNVLGVFAAARDVTVQKQASKKVAESTQELQDKVAELERLNRVMVGRELKMIELKKELEELRSKV